MAYFTCQSCDNQCVGPEVGFELIGNRHLSQLDNIKVPLSRPFPIFDIRGAIHVITLHETIIYQIIAPTNNLIATCFQWLRKIFFGEGPGKDWLDFDMTIRGFRFDITTNLHMLAPNLQKYMTAPDSIIYGEDPEKRFDQIWGWLDQIELVNHAGQVQTYLGDRRSTVTYTRKGDFNPIDMKNINQIRHRTLTRAMGDRFPSPAEHPSWTMEEQRRLFNLFKEVPRAGRTLAQVLEVVADQYRQVPGREETKTWAILEFFLRFYHNKGVEAEKLAGPSGSVQEETPKLEEALSDIRDDFPSWGEIGRVGGFSQFLKALTYRAYVLGSYTTTPVAFTTWRAKISPSLLDLRRVPPRAAQTPGPRWNNDVHLCRFRAACEACLRDGATIVDIYESCRKIINRGKRASTPDIAMKVYEGMGFAPEELTPERMARAVVRTWKLELHPDDPLARYLREKQLAEDHIVVGDERRRATTIIERQYSPPPRLVSPRPPFEMPESEVVSWVDARGWGLALEEGKRIWHAEAQGGRPEVAQPSSFRWPRRLVKRESVHLASHLRNRSEGNVRANIDRAGEGWALAKDAIQNRTDAPPSAVIYADVESLPIPGHPAGRCLSFHICRSDAPRCEAAKQPDTERGHLFTTIDYGMSIRDALSVTRNSTSYYEYAKKQYSRRSTRDATHGTPIGDVAGLLKNFGLTKSAKEHTLMLCWTANNSGLDRRCLAAFPGCDELLPRCLSPCSLLRPLGWPRPTRLAVAFKALTDDEKDKKERDYYESLAENAHMPWADNEMCRIVTERLLSGYY